MFALPFGAYFIELCAGFYCVIVVFFVFVIKIILIVPRSHAMQFILGKIQRCIKDFCLKNMEGRRVKQDGRVGVLRNVPKEVLCVVERWRPKPRREWVPQKALCDFWRIHVGPTHTWHNHCLPKNSRRIHGPLHDRDMRDPHCLYAATASLLSNISQFSTTIPKLDCVRFKYFFYSI